MRDSSAESFCRDCRWRLFSRLEQIELFALLGQRQPIVAYVFDQLFDGRMLGVDVRAFVNAWQKAGLPVLSFLDGITERAHRDERRQVLVIAAKAVA